MVINGGHSLQKRYGLRWLEVKLAEIIWKVAYIVHSVLLLLNKGFRSCFRALKVSGFEHLMVQIVQTFHYFFVKEAEVGFEVAFHNFVL